jgi:hypothetical protein
MGESFPQMNEDFSGLNETQDKNLKPAAKKNPLDGLKKKISVFQGSRNIADIGSLELLKALFVNLNKAEKVSEVMVEVLSTL